MISVLKRAYDNLLSLYGENLPIEILSRFYSEKAMLEGCELYLTYLDLIGKAWTVAQAVDKLAIKGKNGSYIIDTKTHWTAAVIENGEGKIVDLWDSRKEVAVRVWEF